LALSASGLGFAGEEPLRIGSKRFTESYVLGEILTQTVRRAGPQAEHRPGLGNTAILYEALTRGAIDAYPEYTGTIAREILKSERDLDLAAINAQLAPLGLRASFPLGFSNSYALGMKAEPRASGPSPPSPTSRASRPAARASRTSSSARKDGWPGLKAAYGLRSPVPRGSTTASPTRRSRKARSTSIDLYTTDAKIERLGIRVLEDDRRFFPRYEAVILHRADAHALSDRIPRARQAREPDRRAHDDPPQRARRDRPRRFRRTAAEFLGAPPEARAALRSGRRSSPRTFRARRAARGLGLRIAPRGHPRRPSHRRLRRQGALGRAADPPGDGLVQTIPALALLAFLIPITGPSARGLRSSRSSSTRSCRSSATRTPG
jgi:osmoprotectant transport system permease protein